MPEVRPTSAVIAKPPQPQPATKRARSRGAAGAPEFWAGVCAIAGATKKGAALTETLASTHGGRSVAMDPYVPGLSAAGETGDAHADAGRIPGTSPASVQNCQAGGAAGQDGSGSHPCDGTHPTGGEGQPGGGLNITGMLNQ